MQAAETSLRGTQEGSQAHRGGDHRAMIIFRSTSEFDGSAKGRLGAEEGLVHGAVSAREDRESSKEDRGLA